MFISYFDESGDDGYPNYSSPIFVLSALYLHCLNWKDIYNKISQFRKQLKIDFGLPINLEMHLKYFLLGKNPYRQFNLSIENKKEIINLYSELISRLEIKFINVVINKDKINSLNYPVLDRALTYSIQRIENDLTKIDPARKFLIITDEGRLSKMRHTARKIQKINFIPSRYGDYKYRQEIKSLIEDPLPKDSKESYFIQLSDLVAYIVYLYSIKKLKVGKYPNRMPKEVNHNQIISWMDIMKSSFNLEASLKDKYGVVCYPK